MKTLKKLSAAILAWLTKANNYRLSLAKSLKSQMDFGSAVIFLLALGQWLFWYRLWIRSDEFHASLDLNPHLLWSDELFKDYYVNDVVRRRQIAHNRGMALTPG